MKKLFSLLLFSLFSMSAFAQYTEHYLKIQINDRSQLETLTRMVSIDNVIGSEVIAYANDKELEKLTYSQFVFEELEHPSLQAGKAITMATTVAEMANWDRYPTYSVYNQLMLKFATDYPNLCKLDTAGTSIANHNILVLNITADIKTPKPKPELLFSSTIHGDETTGWILCLRLADYLLSNYGSDTRITRMLDSISIFIAPNTNPDGTYRPNDNSIASAQRSNNNGYDLNRNFPDPWVDPNYDNANPGGTLQKEAITMMNFADKRHFILGINYHGGSEVANFPWDGWTSSQRKHADYNWYVQICSKYASLVKTNGPSGYFTNPSSNGYIDGGDWYVIHGGRQDYMNYWHNCREITLEVSNTKLVQSEQLPNYWNYNKEAMLTYIENAKYGIRGMVSNTDGEPLDANITVVGHDNYNSNVVTNPEFGNYYRMIEPGTFSLLFESFGYEPKTISGIVAQQNKTTIQNVTLQKLPTYTISGIVVNSSTGLPVDNVSIEIVNTPITPVITNSLGNFSLTIPTGTYQFVLTKKNFVKKEQTITIDENTDLLLITLDPFDGLSFEDGTIPAGFTFSGNQPWFITNTEAFDGTKSMRSGTIGNNQTSTMIYTFNAAMGGKVVFYSKVSSEAKYDFLRFYIDGTLKESWSGEVDWAEHSYDVSAGTHELKWTYSKDVSGINGSDCAWVDYISLPKNNQNAIPYINPRSIDFATEKMTGDTLITIYNLGNASLNFNATVENAQNNTWLSLLNNSGTLNLNQKNDIILSYNFTSLSNGEYTTHIQIYVADSVINIPVSIVFSGDIHDEYGIPYVTPRSIDIETEELTGNCVVTMKNIGNGALNYSAFIEGGENWLSFQKQEDILEPEQQVAFLMSYDFTSFAKEMYSATLNIEVKDSVIIIPVNINYLLNILTQKLDNFEFYPNPTNGELRVKSEELKVNGVEIFDVSGRKFPSNSLEGWTRSGRGGKEGWQPQADGVVIDISHLQSGIYFVIVTTEKGIITKKVVKY